MKTAGRTAIAASLALGLATLTGQPAESARSPLRFEVRLDPRVASTSQTGRLFVVLSSHSSPEPRFALTEAGEDAPFSLARDVVGFAPGETNVLDDTAFSFPLPKLSALPDGDYFVQAVLDINTDLRSPGAPGNFYSAPGKVHVNAAHSGPIALALSRQVPPEELPPDTDQVRFVKLQSKLLSDFHHRPIYLRAGIVLPRDYDREPERHYPLWVRIGGFNTRYAMVRRALSGRGVFQEAWNAANGPRFILLQLDGDGPLGDPYYVNSANNGPYGDALVQELIPAIEQKFRAIGQPRARVLSGVSTGGWVCLALQIFYPDFFNGAWSSCPDPVDFRAFELVNVHTDANAYLDADGKERPSERDLKGGVVLTMRREVGAENLLGRANSYTSSGQQWGAWNAVYSPRGPDGLPVPLWDPHTGQIDHAVAEQWNKYDLRLVLQENWKTLGPKLRGKLHIASGEADQYFLNNAVHLLDQFLSHAEPPFGGRIAFGPGKGHGWMDLTLAQMLVEMKAATESSK